MGLQSVKKAWQDLAQRADIIGKDFVFDNRIGNCKDTGKIKAIIVEHDSVTIESDELARAHAEESAWSPNIRFKIDEERNPHLVGDIIFCDLDERRQIRISMT